MNYEFHPEAEFEFIEAAAHYESEVPGLGERFARARSGGEKFSDHRRRRTAERELAPVRDNSNDSA